LLRESPLIAVQNGSLSEALAEASLAIASTGTVTLECAVFGVPTVAMYITSWSTFQIGKRIVQVKFLAMPNLLANEAIFPEFIQDDATPENIARAGLDLLNNSRRRAEIRKKLARITESLGGPGAGSRAARAIVQLMKTPA
jgi:lipid-A-disaccharide synthase